MLETKKIKAVTTMIGSAVNSSSNEKTPSISPDGKYLFFGRDEKDGKANIYWVSTQVIENIRPPL
jgi:Tol biopolymer transport system component